MPNLNPFIYEYPVPPGELIDREEEVGHLLEMAEGGHNTRLQGPRRYGKTSVLKKLLDEAERTGFQTVYVDFLAATTFAEVTRRLQEAYEASLKGQPSKMYSTLARNWRGRVRATPGGIGVEAELVGDSNHMQQLADLLDLPSQIQASGGGRVIVVFDEFQDFLRVPGELAGLLRSKMQGHRDAAGYVFCASESAFLEAHFADRKRPLFDQARPLYLSPLADADLGDYIADRFERTGRDATPALDPLLDLVRGHPQRAMLVAHHLWEHTAAGEAADAETFGTALRSLGVELEGRFSYTWQRLTSRSSNAGRVLNALALSAETLYNQRTLKTFQLTKSQANSGERQLIQGGEVWRVGGRPQIIDPLFEGWLRKRGGEASG
jgi:uncharacterized protein